MLKLGKHAAIWVALLPLALAGCNGGGWSRRHPRDARSETKPRATTARRTTATSRMASTRLRACASSWPASTSTRSPTCSGRQAALAASPRKDVALNGFDAIGAAQISLTSFDIDAYEQSAGAIAAAAVATPGVVEQYQKCTPQGIDDYECMRSFVAEFGLMAWRRPLDDDELNRWADVGLAAAMDLGAFAEGVEFVIAGMLQSPNFIYQVEVGEPDDDDPTLRKLSGYESRRAHVLLPARHHAEPRAARARKSSIYVGQPDFAMFGIGEYAFAPHKVAIGGLYKQLAFTLVSPHAGKPVMVDDTAYFLPCTNEVQAQELAAALASQSAQAFFEARVFWSAKRPITKALLQSLSLVELLRPAAARRRSSALSSLWC
ncbi:MAG: DUF1595 domain-containing protein [Deltaproteobacteria bacterium]|nr:DUF1595 domain-containing protein [Deltaproteobacteria bacterium]